MYFSVIGTDSLSIYAVLGISLGAGVLLSLLVHFVIAPWLKKRILNSEQSAIHSSIAADESGENNFNVPDLMVTEETTRKSFIVIAFSVQEATSQFSMKLVSHFQWT